MGRNNATQIATQRSSSSLLMPLRSAADQQAGLNVDGVEYACGGDPQSRYDERVMELVAQIEQMLPGASPSTLMKANQRLQALLKPQSRSVAADVPVAP